MSFINITPNEIETFTIVTNPIRTFSSSSTYGVTGSVNVFPQRSEVEKDFVAKSAFVDLTHDDSDINSFLATLQTTGKTVRNADSSLTEKFPAMLDSFLLKVNDQAQSVRKQSVLEIERFTPSFSFTDNTVKKLVIKENLMPYYRVLYPTAHWAYTNYNSLNFFTASGLPTTSCLMYPNLDENPFPHDGYVSGTYSVSGAFSFDFYINPKYKPDARNGSFKAGTIFHLSSSYAVSLISGSSVDENGKTNGFRIQLQLSHSADIKPSVATAGTYPSDLIFKSDDNALSYNNWHHVVIRWGTSEVNKGTGSFNVDGVDRGFFVVPSGTISPKLFTNATRANPDVLCIGNFYEGNNNGVNAQAYFFANDPASRDGLEQLINDVGGIDEPSHYLFAHPLNAELHDLSIKRYYMSDVDIVKSASVGPSFIDDSIAFYVPPFFVESSSFRRFVGDHGGILQTPFFEVDGTTNDPFNVAMSFGVGGHYINIENFTRDFASNTWPRLHHMTGVAIDYTTNLESANDFLYAQSFVKRRNLLVMPCDDGLFVPSFDLLVSESLTSNFVDDVGAQEFSFIHLDNLISTSSLVFGTSFETNTGEPGDVNVEATSNQQFINQQIGFSPEQPGTPPGPAFVDHISTIDDLVASGTFEPGVQGGAPLTIYQRTRDNSSNQMVFFDVSNIFYGMSIHPKSLVISDSDLFGSSGTIGVTLKDDGYGNIYRADAVTPNSTWNSVGNVFYNEGIIVIKSPHLFFFGLNQFNVSFRGEQNVHTIKFELIADAGHLNSSSNPNYKSLPASGFSTDTDPNYVYISGINLHDKNYNIVAKTQLAQPILKRFNDRILFKTTLDF